MSDPFPRRPCLTMDGVARGARQLAPMAVFVVPFGLAFGVAAIERGLAPLQAIVMSVTVQAGAAQFAALDLWDHPLPMLTIVLTVLAVNARHLILGAALSPWVNQLPQPRRTLSLVFLSDANFAVSHNAFQQGERDIGHLVGGGLALWAAWVFGTAVGAVAGTSLGSLDRFGIDMVMAAFFVALVLEDRPGLIRLPPMVIAATVAVVGASILPVGWNIILAALAGGLTGMLCRER